MNEQQERQEKNAVFNGGKANPMGPVAPVPRVEEVPYEEVPLPSAGKVYGEHTTLHGRETVDIKVMTAKEEDILSNPSYLKKGTVITELLRSSLVDKSIDVSDMIAGDRNAIMVFLRITGYGSRYPAEITCSDCGFEWENTFKLNELKMEKLQIEPEFPGENCFKFELPVSGDTVFFKFLTGKDEESINMAEEKMKKLGILNVSPITQKLKYSILRINDVSDKTYIANYVDRMRAGDSKALRKYIDTHEPGMIMRQEAVCPACNNTEEVGMPLGVQFFWPE